MSILGCTEPVRTPPATPVSPREAPWVEQIAAVRTGSVDAVRTPLTPVTTEQWTMLAQQCESLEVLEVDVRKINPDALDILGGLPELRNLILHGPIDDSWIERIAALSSIQNLNLPDAQFTDEGLVALAALPELELLRFGSAHVTDEGMRTISAFPALRFLHLIDVPITDQGLAHLHGMTALESFYLDGGDCTDSGLRGLLQALPELHFHRDQLHLPDDPHAHPHESAAESRE